MDKKQNKKNVLAVIIVTAVITGTLVWAVLTFTGHGRSSVGLNPDHEKQQTADSSAKERKIIYWRAPMDPMEIYDEPGKSKMGMDLVPVYEDDVSNDAAGGKRTIVYWRAPMDPMEIYDNPGKSKMGMDLVPVYEDELVGGVDIKIDPVVEQNMGLKTETVEKGLLHHTIRTYGHITYDETRIGAVSQKIDGWIEKLYVDYTGFFVKKGDPLYEVYAPSLIASQEEYLSAFNNYQRNKSSLNREMIASARKRLSFFDIADSEISALEARGQVQKTLVIRSPYTGVVTHKNVVEGLFVKAGTSVYSLADLSHVWVEAHIFEYEQNLVSLGQDVEMILSYNPDRIYKGEINYIFPYLQQKTRDIIIRIDFSNPDLELKPDMFAKISIKTPSKTREITISSESVIHAGEEEVVFVAKGGGRFSPRTVITGVHLDNGRVQVVSGLKAGEIVVTSGQFLLDSESKLKEAVQKMITAKSAPAADVKADTDNFFDDMETEEDFFKDMK